MDERPAKSRRQQSRASRGDGLPGVQDAACKKNFQKLRRQQGKTAGQGAHPQLPAAQPSPGYRSRHPGCQFEPHIQRLKCQAAHQRPHAGSQQIRRRTPHDQRQTERRCAAIDLPRAQGRSGDGGSPLPRQRRPAGPCGQQHPDAGFRGMYILLYIGKNSHWIVSPFMLYAVR